MALTLGHHVFAAVHQDAVNKLLKNLNLAIVHNQAKSAKGTEKSRRRGGANKAAKQ